MFYGRVLDAKYRQLGRERRQQLQRLSTLPHLAVPIVFNDTDDAVGRQLLLEYILPSVSSLWGFRNNAVKTWFVRFHVLACGVVRHTHAAQ